MLRPSYNHGHYVRLPNDFGDDDDDDYVSKMDWSTNMLLAVAVFSFT